MTEEKRVRRRPGFEGLANMVSKLLDEASGGQAGSFAPREQELLVPIMIGVAALAIVEALELKHEADIPRFYKA